MKFLAVRLTRFIKLSHFHIDSVRAYPFFRINLSQNSFKKITRSLETTSVIKIATKNGRLRYAKAQSRSEDKFRAPPVTDFSKISLMKVLKLK